MAKMSPTIFANATPTMQPSKTKASILVSPDKPSVDGNGFWVDCFGSLQDSLPNLCGESGNKSAGSNPAIVEETIDTKSSIKLGLKASIKRVGSFGRSVSHEDLSSDCSSVDSQRSQSQWRRRLQRQTNRDTRDPSPSIDNNNTKRNSDKSDGKRESESPLLKDPPNTRKRARSVPLEKLLNSSRRDKGAKVIESSPSFGGGLGVTSINTKMLNILEKTNVERFASKHDEVVTALIDDALQCAIENSSSTSIDRERTTTFGSPLRKKGSPYRKKIATPQWLRNRSKKSDEPSPVGSGASTMTRFTNVNTSAFFHPKCDLYKENGSSKVSSQGRPPSAVGREAALAKLMQKLSLLSEIESGKYGKGADMLRSDAVAVPIQGYMGLEAVETRSILTIRMGFVSMNYGIVLQWDLASELAKQVVLVKMCHDNFLDRSHIEFSNSGNHTVVTDSDIEEENSIVISDDSRTVHSPGRSLKTDLSSSGVGQAHLAVSILNVKQLVPRCDHAHHCAWPWLRATDPKPKSKSRKSNHSDVRPYVRFVFGRNEHLTKSVKFNKGSITWKKRHRNSCSLPCPPEDQRWFAGQDDLIVEVRSKRKSTDNSPSTPMSLSFFKEEKSSSKQKHKVTDDPLLAAVKVPLSSIIFDEEDVIDSLNGKKKWALSRVTRVFKKLPSKTKDGPSSNNITLPLPMKSCSLAPFGSISLSITMKTPATQRGKTPPPTPSVKRTPSPQKKRTRHTKVASHQQVEGIELLPLTSFISSWVNDGSDANSKNKNKATMSKVMMWTKRYDPRTKKWSNVNATIKRSRSFKKSSKKKHEDDDDDKSIMSQVSIISQVSSVVDLVMGMTEVKEEKKLFSLKPATKAMQQAKSELNRSLHKVTDQVKEKKKVVESRLAGGRVNESKYQGRRRASAASRIANGRRGRNFKLQL